MILVAFVVASTFRINADKPYWISFLNITVLVLGCLALFIFLVWFYAELLEFRAQPEMAKQIIERDRTIMELQMKFNVLVKNEPKEGK